MEIQSNKGITKGNKIEQINGRRNERNDEIIGIDTPEVQPQQQVNTEPNLYASTI